MRSYMLKGVLLLAFFCMLPGSGSMRIEAQDNDEAILAASSAGVVFIELGSVNCIPCRMMQEVMKQVEENYPDEVEVIFYDVWSKEESHYAQEYGIRVIPTQVFLDGTGKEFFRHEGFFPYEEIVKLLEMQGITD